MAHRRESTDLHWSHKHFTTETNISIKLLSSTTKSAEMILIALTVEEMWKNSNTRVLTGQRKEFKTSVASVVCLLKLQMHPSLNYLQFQGVSRLRIINVINYLKGQMEELFYYLGSAATQRLI